jgi:hypothetical protein
MATPGSLNSSRFPDIVEGLEHSKTNPAIIHNASRTIDFLGKFITGEPRTVAHNRLDVIRNRGKLPTVEWSSDYKMRPEAFAQKMYGTPDLWWVIMHANECMDRTKFATVPGVPVKYYTTDTISDIINIINRRGAELKALRTNPLVVDDLTIVNVDY